MSETVKIAKDLRFLFNGPNAGQSPRVIKEFRNNSGGSLAPGDVVIFDTTVTYPAVTTTTAADNVKVAGVVAEASLTNELCKVVVDGYVSTINVNGTTAISVGDTLSTYTAAKIGQKATAGKGGGFAIALAAYAVADSLGAIAGIVKLMGNDSTGTATLGTAGQMAADGLVATNSAGVSANVAPIDHAHAYTNDTPALVLGTSNAVGTVGKPLAADASIALFDTTNPVALVPGASASTGTAAFAAHRDHGHSFVAAAAPVDGSLGASNAAGSGTTISYSDHTHKSILKNDIDLILGTTDAVATATRIEYDTAETNAAVKVGVDSTSRRVILLDYGDMGVNTTYAGATDPELVFMDATAAESLKIHTTLTGAEYDVSTGNTQRFLVNGSLVADIDNLGNYRAGNGTVSGAALTFRADVGLGFYRIGANNLGLTVNGTKTWDYAQFLTSFTGANGTSNTDLQIINSTNTAVDAESIVDIQVGGTTTTGDPQLRLTIPSGGTSWYVGVDNSVSDRFEIGLGTAVGTTQMITLDGTTTGVSQLIGATLNPQAATLSNSATAYYRALSVGAMTATLAGTTQVTGGWDYMSLTAGGLTVAQSGGAVTVDQIGMVTATAPTPGASVTLTRGIAFEAHNGTVTGTGTNQYGFYCDALTGYTNNYAFWNNGASADVVLQGSGALATTATRGFTYLPTCAGAPSGVPNGVTGAVPLIFDTTNNKIMVYNVAWKGVAVA